MDGLAKKEFEFSIIMAVYNVEPFLKEAVCSLLSQDIGFEENVQLIMVDDGSTDNSGMICDRYGEFFPDNITVIHQENAGVSAARNAGLPYVQGKYVNCMDADDKMASNALRLVRDFYQKHDDEVDLVSIPLEFFDAQTGAHPLNYKFKKGTRIIDLRKEPNSVQLHFNSSFVRAEAMEGITFDTNLTYAEDAKAVVSVILQRCMLGVVAGTKYYYRRRSIGASAIQNSGKTADYYLPYMHSFAEYCFETSRQLYGNVLPFVQYDIMYDLQWRLIPLEQMHKVLTDEEIEEYKDCITKLLQEIDDEVIMAQKNIWEEHKTYLWSKKHETSPVIKLNDAEDDFELYLNEEKPYFKISRSKTVYEFLNIDKDKDTLTIEGYTTLLGFPENEPVNLYIRLNSKHDLLCETVEGRELDTEVLGDKILKAYPFRCTIPEISKFENRGIDLVLVMEVRGIKILRLSNIRTANFFPFGRGFKDVAYAEAAGWLIRFGRDEHLVITKTEPEAIEAREELLLSAMSKKGVSGKRAIRRRRLAKIMKPFFKKEIWLISDRINKADDSGEALFSYLQNQKNVDIYFVISKDSSDYKRLETVGKVVEYLSEEHLLLHLMADRIISTAANAYVMNPFAGERWLYRDILVRKQQIFLQHGVIKDDLSDWLNRYEKDLAMFVTTARAEYESILDGDYYYDEKILKLTGLPRYDLLEDRREKQIVIMPTWRQELDNHYDIGGNAGYSKDGIKQYHESIKESEYFCYYNQLINNKRLITAAQKYGYKIMFMPHPNIQPYEKWFEHNPAVTFCSTDVRYRDVISTSCLAVTDYSSVVFDFAYLRKPVIYTQFDKENFYNNHLYNRGYFDYERDGFGEVEYDLEHTVNRIVEYMANGCKLKDEYRERIEKFFVFNDKENCKRTYEAILSLGKPDSFPAWYKDEESSSNDMKNISLALLHSAAKVEDGEALGMLKKLPPIAAPAPKAYMRYIFPSHLFKEGERVAIYGAGEVGTEFFRQAKLYGYVDPVMIVDRNAASMQPTADLPVQPVKALLQEDKYDSILIAIRFERIAGPVKIELMAMGIPEEKIKWDGEVYFADDWGKKFWKRKATEEEEA